MRLIVILLNVVLLLVPHVMCLSISLLYFTYIYRSFLAVLDFPKRLREERALEDDNRPVRRKKAKKRNRQGDEEDGAE